MLNRQFEFSQEFLNACFNQLRNNPTSLFRIDPFRVHFAQERLDKALSQSSRQLKAHCREDTEDMISNTIRHNVESLNPRIAAYRPMGLMGPLLGMDQVMRKMFDTKILIIGPRTEQEILWYIGMGFNSNNITGLDLFTYSDYIQTGDMHHLDFEDNSFDVIIFSWVLGYSTSQRKAVAEAVRCVKPNGLVGIGEQWDPTPVEVISQQMSENAGYSLEGTVTTSYQQLIDLFDVSVKPRFINEPLDSMRDGIGHISVIVEVMK